MQLSTFFDYEKIVETVQLLSSVETPVDTASYDNILDKEGQIPSRWTAGAGIAFESKSEATLAFCGYDARELDVSC